MVNFFAHLHDKYGSVVGYATSNPVIIKLCPIITNMIRFYIGQKPYITITDMDMLKQILVKDFNNFMDRTVSAISMIFLHIEGESLIGSKLVCRVISSPQCKPAPPKN